MTKTYVERELKFDVDPGFVVPDVGPLLPRGGRTMLSSELLQSEYFDTADLALLRARMVLRRRSGTSDTGWQLKVPDGEFREEIRLDDVESAGIPRELETLLTGVRHGQSLRPIATITTQRAVTRLVHADGQVIAEVDDDTVHAAAAGETATLTSWREVEVELGDADLEVLHTLGKQLRQAGARPSPSPSKLSRLVSGSETGRATGKKASAEDIVASYLLTQHQAILVGDLALRRADDSVIHDVRVATRRFRSTLRVFDEFFEPDGATNLDQELRWYAGLLGEVRDRQVLRKRLGKMVDQLDRSALLGPVQTRIDSELSREHREHWQQLVGALDSERYLALLAALDNWTRHTPGSPLDHHTEGDISKAVHRAERKVAKRLRAAAKSGDAGQLHRARKATKRARYATEAAQPVSGNKKTKRRNRRYRELQDVLGEHQDATVSADILRRLGAAAGTSPGENGFSFGILREREESNARTARAKARHLAQQYK